MQRFSTLIVGVLLLTGGCQSNRVPEILHPWGWESVEHARIHLGRYRHVFIAQMDSCNWEDRGPNNLTPLHFKGTVVETYKGDWKVSEPVAFGHHTDARPVSASDSPCRNVSRVFIFANEHTSREILLDTGEFGHYRDELRPALEYLFPKHDPTR